MRLLLLLLACPAPAERCDVGALAAERAGLGATDCGLAQAGDDDDVHACVVAAFREGRPFYGLVETSVGSGLLVRAWVSDGEAVEIVLADFEGCDASTCQGSVVAQACPEPAVETVEGREQLGCTWEEPPCGVLLCGADPGC